MDAVSGLFRSVIWNETIPDRLRGRLAGVEMISYTVRPDARQLRGGRRGIVRGRADLGRLGRLMCVVGTGVVLAFLPAFWRYDARHEAARGSP